jgi:16S rRNA (uracil1498-N3)-methyltransferase
MLYSFFEGNLSGRIVLSADESHHLVSVRRAEDGASFTILDGKGNVCLCRLTVADRRAAEAEILSVRRFKRPAAHLWLAQAMPLGGVMETIVQKATELGAERIVPLVTERSELRLDAVRMVKKLEKWRQIAIEAVKQCGNPFMPEIAAPASIDELINQQLPKARAVCSLESGASAFLPFVASADSGEGIIVAIGPEGDFTQGEYEKLRRSGFVPISLGPLVLRSDTAAIAALAIASEGLRKACSLSDEV